MESFTHMDENGNAVMVDVSGKEQTSRSATARGIIEMAEDCYQMVREHRMKKGDVLGVAQVAGIMGAKKTSELIPLTHILLLTGIRVEFIMHDENHTIEAVCTVSCKGVTGVEMEALTGVSTALLTIYDMCKAVDKFMSISDIRLVEKHGGKSGDFYAG